MSVSVEERLAALERVAHEPQPVIGRAELFDALEQIAHRAEIRRAFTDDSEELLLLRGKAEVCRELIEALGGR